MTEPLDTFYIPVTGNDNANETQPLLSRSPQQHQQPNSLCTRGAHCLAGTHKTTSSFTILLRLLVALTIVYIIVCTRRWLHSTGIVIDKRCLRSLVPWTGGPANITSDTAKNLEVLLTKGPISATVEVLTQEGVEHPTVVVEAWVSENYPLGDGDNSSGRGLEVEITEVDNKLKIVFTAEDSTTRHRPLLLQPFTQKFCAKVHLKIIFPYHLRSYGRLFVSGCTLALTTYNIAAIAFESINIGNFGGDILFYDIPSSSSASSVAGEGGGGGGGVQTAKGLSIITATGSISVPSVRATPGQALSLSLWSSTGRVHFNATMNAILKTPNKTAWDLTHSLVLTTGMGHVQGVLRFAEGAVPDGVLKAGEKHEEEWIPGGIWVHSYSWMGYIGTELGLALGQNLWQEMRTVIGTVETTV
ncbi:hypothetical protein BGZ96_011876, partial [Linnemannia gamsii]